MAKKIPKRKQQEKLIKEIWSAISVTELSGHKDERDRFAQLAFTILVLLSGGGKKGVGYSLKAYGGGNVELANDLYMKFYDLDPRKQYEGILW